jgi:CheY-like chemotaxis protein
MSTLKDCVLVVDDEFLIAQGLCAQIQDLGMEVCATAATADEAIAQAQAHRPRVVLMDVRLRGEINATVGSKMIFVTGSREPTTIARIALDHPSAVLFKPVSDLQLRTAIQSAVAEPDQSA